jgi:SAM-dependent methyltransferase
VLADMHRMPFPAGSFSLVISSFGLNGTDPDHSLRALRDRIAPGGRLVLQEWGPVTPTDKGLHSILEKYILEEPGERMAALREWVENNPAHWRDQLQDADDYAEWLTDLGFTVEDATQHAPLTIRIPSAEMYLTFHLAWTYRFEEVRAMDHVTREAYMAEARSWLAKTAAPDGSIWWSPVLFRVSARKK